MLAPWQVVRMMVACLVRRALPLDRTHGGLSTSSYRPTSPVSLSPTIAMTTSVIIAKLLYIHYNYNKCII